METHSRHVTKLILLASQDLPQDAAHNLATASLGQVGHDVDRLGRGKRSDALAHLQDKLLAERIRGLGSVLEGHEGIDSLARELIGNTNDGSLGDRVVLDQGRLDLGRRQTVTADVDDVINAAADPVESLVVTTSTVAGELRMVSFVGLSRQRTERNSRSSRCTRSGKSPCSACGHPRRCGPLRARAA